MRDAEQQAAVPGDPCTKRTAAASVAPCSGQGALQCYLLRDCLPVLCWLDSYTKAVETALQCRRLAATGAEPKAGWVDSDAASADQIMASAMDEMQVKCTKLDLQNARLRLELVRLPLNAVLSACLWSLPSTSDENDRSRFQNRAQIYQESRHYLMCTYCPHSRIQSSMLRF